MPTSEKSPLLAGAASRREKSEALTGMVLMFLVVLLGDGNRGLVLPTLAGYIHKYGGGSRKLAMANAGFSTGRLLVAPWLGLWMDRRPVGEVVVFTLAVCLVCNLFYMTADTFGSHFGADIGLWCIVISRSILGIGACVLGIGRGYITKHTTRSRRTAVISLLCAAQFFGFTAFSGFSLMQHEGFLKAMGLNHYTFPGAVLCFLYATLLAVVLLVPSNFWDPPQVYAASPRNPNETPQVQYGTPSATTVSAAQKDHSGPSFHLVLALTFILLNFTIRAILATQETLGTCVVHYLYSGENVCHHKVVKIVGESVKAAAEIVGMPTEKETLFFVAAFFTSVGLMGMLLFLILYFVAPYMEDRIMLLFGLIATTIGLACMLDPNDGAGLEHEMSLTRFGIGFGVAWAIGYPFTQTVVVSALSKVLDPSQVGQWMGYQASAGSAGRVVGPLLSGFIYQELGENDGFLPFTGCFACALISTVLVGFYWEKLKV